MKRNEQGRQFDLPPRYERFDSARNEQQAALWRQQTEAPFAADRDLPPCPEEEQPREAWRQSLQEPPQAAYRPAPPQWVRQPPPWPRQTAGSPPQPPMPMPMRPSGERRDPPPVWNGAEGREQNPWRTNLPAPPKKKKRRGIWLFAAMLAVLAGSTAVYGFFAGPTPLAPDSSGDGRYEALDSRENGTTIPKTGGGSARLQMVRTHGEALTAKEVFQKVNPAVVTVAAVHKGGTASIGTGVIFTEDGYLLTNAHVIEGGESCLILLPDGRRYDASLVGYDLDKDVAVLKAMNASGLPTAEIGNSADLVEGDKVYAIGNPLGLELRNTLTDGIISAVNRKVTVEGRVMTMIQTNAALNAGNSGGPLINEYGQVVGLNTVKMVTGFGETDVEGLGFAIPSETVEYLANQILRRGESLPETSIGVTVSPLDREGNRVEGLYVHAVAAGSCADTAGIRPDDIILTADGVPVTETYELLAARHTHAPGEELVLTVRRGEETFTAAVVLDAAEES